MNNRVRDLLLLAPLILSVGLIYMGFATPTEAAIAALVLYAGIWVAWRQRNKED